MVPSNAPSAVPTVAAAPAAPLAAATGPAIDVRGLARRFEVGRRRHRRTVEAVAGITFAVEPGERLAFIGPNGAGKSTSIKMLTGVLHPSAGSARVLGLEPWTQRRALSRRIGTLFGQRSALWSELSARASLRTLGAIHGLDEATVAARTTELADLLDAAPLLDQPVRTLSLGQRMRCELAACMLHRPRLLFLDEPTIGLDLLAKQRFRDVLVRLNREQATTIVLTSHDVADVEHVAERAIIVNHGTIIHDSPVASLRRDLLATKRVEIGLSDPAEADTALAALAEVPGAGPGVRIERTEQGLALDVDTGRHAIGPVLAAVLDRWPLADVSVVDPPLEQVIGEIYRRPR